MNVLLDTAFSRPSGPDLESDGELAQRRHARWQHAMEQALLSDWFRPTPWPDAGEPHPGTPFQARPAARDEPMPGHASPATRQLPGQGAVEAAVRQSLRPPASEEAAYAGDASLSQ
ncbi:MAG TPA: hypothetical protein VNB23_07335, partial [Ramlibacter sp.]|nr:hypothetical protein [Ramlibacter sp.]